MTKELTTNELITKAVSRSSLGRHEQRQLGLALRDKLKQCEYQAKMIRELREEVIRLKIVNSEVIDAYRKP